MQAATFVGRLQQVARDAAVADVLGQLRRPAGRKPAPDLAARNRVVQTVLIAPMTTGGWTTSFRAPVVFKGKDGLVVPDQIRSIDRRRLRKRLGQLQDDDLQTLIGVIRTIFET